MDANRLDYFKKGPDLNIRTLVVFLDTNVHLHFTNGVHRSFWIDACTLVWLMDVSVPIDLKKK